MSSLDQNQQGDQGQQGQQQGNQEQQGQGGMNEEQGGEFYHEIGKGDYGQKEQNEDQGVKQE